MRLGEIVFSIAGRDKDRYYVVVSIENESRVKVADGEFKSIKNAKLKNVKHIKSSEVVLEKIEQKLMDGDQVFDTEIRSALRSYNEGVKN